MFDLSACRTAGDLVIPSPLMSEELVVREALAWRFCSGASGTKS